MPKKIEATPCDQMRGRITASLADPRKSVAAAKVFKRLRAIHRKAMRTS
jgi:hypothetical protein